MADQLELDGRSVVAQLRDLIGEMGSAHIKELGREALERGIWPQEQVDGATLAWACKQIRDAYRHDPATGLPVAVPIESGKNPLWKRLNLIDPDEVTFVLNSRFQATMADYKRNVALWRYFGARFGVDRLPPIPILAPDGDESTVEVRP